MLPSIVANELRTAIARFLRSAFPIATTYFQRKEKGGDDALALIDDLIARDGALFKGPYLDIKLPFRKADAALPFQHITLPFVPYKHQLTAFQRLGGTAPQSTIVATGTGSGKTECFMLPVLDDCLQRRERGIKTLVVYPMNALATDQAKRFAKEVEKIKAEQGVQLSVGLFVGSDGGAEQHVAMGPDHVITDHNTLRKNPPDILLTNYKMLDFLLIRPKDQPLWRYNKPGFLRYLVVDELHTFDGAQGTDLACLIRRLRDRLDAGPELACVGTSATMGSGSKAPLVAYASKVFATEFDEQGVIGEDRLTPTEYLPAQENIEYAQWPDRDERRLNPEQYDSVREFVFHQARLWFPELPVDELSGLNSSDEAQQQAASVRLGELLRRHSVFHELVHSAGQVQDLNELAERWYRHMGLPSHAQALSLINSLTALVSTARVWRNQHAKTLADRCGPFLELRVQLWLRELRRLVSTVPNEPDGRSQLVFSDDEAGESDGIQLPLLHCRECHLGAWGVVQKKGDSHIEDDLQLFYQAWFGYSPQAALLVPLVDGEQAPEGPEQYLCVRCRRLQTGRTCVECESDTLKRVWLPNRIKDTAKQSEKVESHHDCPGCGARESMAIVGYRAATLTSVMAGRLFSTPYNDDHKLIAFSDSVQDAAHRAGFLGANTWRQVMRQAMTLWLRQQPVALSLADMGELFPSHWRNACGDDASFCGTFIAPNMTWLADYQKLQAQGHLPPGSDLPELINKRLSWECTAEFGRRGGVGRSLERAGVASVGMDSGALRRDLMKLATPLREEIEALREVSDQALEQFVLGWLHHLRQVGAIDHPVLNSYLQYRGNEFQINRLPWMPGFGRSQRPPAGITQRYLSQNLESVYQANRATWSVNWLKKCLGQEHAFIAAEAQQLFALLLNKLTRQGWLVEHSAGDDSVWMLNPERLLVEAATAEMTCSDCRHSLVINPDMVPLYQGMTCLRGPCTGTLKLVSPPLKNREYGRDQPRRLVPHEHTALLPDEVRQYVEGSFINGRRTWDVNLLSATPTLEMGIDIGDLSSVFLCSVPPGQANYLQRIGRAGRRDGNALAVTLANGDNHDLYFYGEPTEMIAGEVQSPGVFLQATAVLERQLIAYCFDRWAASGIDDSAIPGELRKVLDAVEFHHQDRFPYNLFDFISKRREALLVGFLAMFPELPEEGGAYLQAFIHDEGEGAFRLRLLNRLTELVTERQGWLKNIKQLTKELAILEKLPKDETTQQKIWDFRDEQGAYKALLTSRNKKLTLNFLTDEGILPNYAFPEEGVTLQSVILRRLSKEEQTEAEGKTLGKTSYTFQRPAQAALSELAPQASFYAVSHKMNIEQVDMNVSTVEAWRFCDRCQYSENVSTGDKHSACPRCGSAQWPDKNQLRDVLKLRQVFATVDDRRHRISDDADQRESTFFNRQVLVDIPPDECAGGFRLKSDTLPFGFEWVRRANLREVNFGERGGDSHVFSVAGREMARRGFSLCRSCGMVQRDKPRRGDKPHAFTCKWYQKPEQATEADFLDSLYLYRELRSEAIRILLPLSEVAYSDEKLHSFIAALNLGLREYFKGDVHHLEVTDMHEPAAQGQSERVYLVVYDRIPGGTGYLKDLMRAPQALERVLRLAFGHLQACPCADDEGKDGCYRCILAYRDRRNMAVISRRQAAELLADILAQWSTLEPVDSLRNIDTNTLVESELEQKVLDALRNLSGARFSAQMVNGKLGGLLTLAGADGRPVAWRLEHQVKLGPTDGVGEPTEVDLLLHPARAADAERYRPIAIYADGLQYHHDIVDDDALKRMALLRSGRYWVFSLNWDDVPTVGKKASAVPGNLMALSGVCHPQMQPLYDKVRLASGWEPASTHNMMQQQGSFELLECLLREPDLADRALRQRATYRGFTALVPPQMAGAGMAQKFHYELNENAPQSVVQAFAVDQPGAVFGGFGDALENSPGRVELAVAVPADALKSSDITVIATQLRMHLCFDDRDNAATDEFKAAWRALWHAANQLQFVPGFSLASRRAVDSGALEALWQHSAGWTDQSGSGEPEASPGESQAPQAMDEGWQEVFELSLLETPSLSALQALGLPAPEVGADLYTTEGEVLISLELAWREQRVGVMDPDDPLPKAEGDLAGWRFVPGDANLIQMITTLQTEGVW